MGPEDIHSVTALLDAAASDADGPLGEQQRLALAHGGGEGFAGVLAREPGDDRPVAYAQVLRGKGSWTVEFVVDPRQADRITAVGTEVVGAALDVVASEGGGRVRMWVHRATAEDDAVASAVGLRAERELYQMRRPLPVDDAHRFGAAPLAVRAFRVGEDEAAWLGVNNRAFHGHPEQGNWDLEMLLEREKQSWFDPDGFLLYEDEGRLAGFCWTKIHRGGDPSLGEIYVIGADPDYEGHGLGKRLVLAGLDWLAGKGLKVGMLYVDAANPAAVHLYEKLGFTVDHVDRAYVGDVPAAS